MKRIIILICILINISISAQNINWGTPYRTEENFYSSTKLAAGKYLGEIAGFNYYVVYSPYAKTFGFSYFMKLIFIAESQNNVSKVSKYSELAYHLLDIKIINNMIAVFYIEDTSTPEKSIKIDYYSSQTFIKQSSKTLFNYRIQENQLSGFNTMLTSEDKSKFGFITYCYNDGTPSLLFSVYDNQLSKLYTQDYIINDEGFNSFSNAILTNNGDIILNFVNYQSKNYEKVTGFQLIQVNSDQISELNMETGLPIKYCSSSWIEKENNRYVFVYTTENGITGNVVSFKNDDITQLFTQNYYDGNWIIEKLIKMENGNIVAVVANKTHTIIHNQKAPDVHAYTYKNYSFDCFDPESSNLLYHSYLGRKFQWGFLIPERDPFLTMPLSVFAKGNDIYAIYNTDRKTKEEINPETESKRSRSFSYHPTIKSITKMAIIDESGKVKTNLLFEYREAKGQCATSFTYLDKDGSFKISKIFRKYITFGTIKL